MHLLVELLPMKGSHILYTANIHLTFIDCLSYCPWIIGLFCTQRTEMSETGICLLSELLPLIDLWQLTCIVWLSYYPWKVGIFWTLAIFIWHLVVDSHSPWIISILYLYTDYIKLMFVDWVIALDQLAFSVHR